MGDEVRNYSYRGPVGDSPAGRTMSRAIDLATEDKCPFPDRALFVDVDALAEVPEPVLAAAARDGLSVVLVSPDMTTQVAAPEEILRREVA